MPHKNRYLVAVLLLLGPIIIITSCEIQFGVQNRCRKRKLEEPASGEFPKTLLLRDGKSITISTLPVRIVAANCGAADILSMLVLPERLAAVPDQVEDYAANPEFWKSHKTIPRFEKFQAERILGYRPDLVVSSALQDGGAAAAIEEQHVPILFLNDFRSLNEIRGTLEIMGQAVGAQIESTRLIFDFDSRLEKVATMLTGKPPVSVVAYSNFGTGFTVGSGVCQHDILIHAGGLNLSAERGIKGNATLTFEQLLRMDPEYIVVTGDNGLECPQAQLLLNEPALHELRAVKNRHIAVVPQRYFDALSQYAVNAVEILAAQLHPETKH